MDTQATPLLRGSPRREMDEHPIYVKVRTTSLEHTKLLARLWEGIEGIRRAQAMMKKGYILVYASDEQATIRDLAGMLVDYIGLIDTITDSDTYKCTTVSYNTTDRVEDFDTGIPIEKFGRYGDLVVDVAQLLAGGTGKPALYFLLQELRHHRGERVKGFRLGDCIPDMSEEGDEFEFMLPKYAAAYYADLREFIRGRGGVLYKDFSKAVDMALSLGYMNYNKLEAISMSVAYLS